MTNISLVCVQISKAAIKNYQMGRRIPHCGFELELLSEQVQRLRHKVVIKGIASLKDFHIRYPQPEGNKAGAGMLIILMVCAGLLVLSYTFCSECYSITINNTSLSITESAINYSTAKNSW